MDILFTILLFLFLNLKSIILIIMGVVLIKDKNPFGKISIKQSQILGTVLIVIATIWAIHGWTIGYGIQ